MQNTNTSRLLTAKKSIRIHSCNRNDSLVYITERGVDPFICLWTFIYRSQKLEITHSMIVLFEKKVLVRCGLIPEKLKQNWRHSNRLLLREPFADYLTSRKLGLCFRFFLFLFLFFFWFNLGQLNGILGYLNGCSWIVWRCEGLWGLCGYTYNLIKPLAHFRNCKKRDVRPTQVGILVSHILLLKLEKKRSGLTK